MAINVGDKIPTVDLSIMTADGPEGISTDDIFGGNKVVIFGLPGAFTPTCSAKHLPGFVNNAEALKAKGGHVMMVADGSAVFTKATGLELDLTEKGLGLRCQRFSMVVDDGEVKNLHIDEAGGFETTSAEVLLGEL